MIESIKKDKLVMVAVIFFVAITAWWLYILLSGLTETSQNYAFAATYGLICLLGGLSGLTYAKKWGGFSSVIGQAMISLSLGLLLQEFGQLIFSYYNIFLGVEIPYPSIADLGFFGSIFFYILGAFFLAKAAGLKFVMKAVSSKFQILVIPAVMLTASYFFFLKDYQVDWTDSLRVVLDFGYPLGEAFYISIALLAYILSRKILGGVMKKVITILVVGFVIQYIADFNFLFQSSRGTWINGGYGDYLYFLAYFVIAYGLMQFRTVLDSVD